MKKSESLEIRLPYPTKQAFMARCRADGRSASEALRGFIETEIEGRPARPRLRPLIAGALAAAAIGAVAVPSLAHPAASAEFQALDLDHDGAISTAEFAALDADHDGRVSLSEFTKARAGTGRAAD